MHFPKMSMAVWNFQEGTFEEEPMSGFLPDDTQFWVADLSVGYRLPKRFGLISVEAKNLFDQKFKFQDTDLPNPRFSPERMIFGRFTLAF